MRIDAHQHFWLYDPLRDTWITDEMKKIQKDFLPAQLTPILTDNAIDGCVAIQADQSKSETDFLLELCEQTNAIKGVVGWVDLRSDEVEERLQHYTKFNMLKGFRHVVQAENQEDFLQRADFCRGVSLLNKYSFTYDILIYPRQLASTIDFVDRFPDQKFVLDHIAKPLIRDGQIDEWAGGIRQLAMRKNVSCKISGVITEAAWKTWIYDDLVPYLEIVLDSFGIERIMYGSDWPVCLLAGTYEEQQSVTEKFFRNFSDSEREAIFGKNAVEFYNL